MAERARGVGLVLAPWGLGHDPARLRSKTHSAGRHPRSSPPRPRSPFSAPSHPSRGTRGGGWGWVWPSVCEVQDSCWHPGGSATTPPDSDPRLTRQGDTHGAPHRARGAHFQPRATPRGAPAGPEGPDRLRAPMSTAARNARSGSLDGPQRPRTISSTRARSLVPTGMTERSPTRPLQARREGGALVLPLYEFFWPYFTVKFAFESATTLTGGASRRAPWTDPQATMHSDAGIILHRQTPPERR